MHPENADEYADCIMENVTHIDEMIAGVLGLAQLERRTAPPMKDKADLTAPANNPPTPLLDELLFISTLRCIWASTYTMLPRSA